MATRRRTRARKTRARVRKTPARTRRKRQPVKRRAGTKKHRHRRRSHYPSRPQRARFFREIYDYGSSKARSAKKTLKRWAHQGTDAFSLEKENYSTRVYTFVKQYQNYKIVSLNVCRKPISSAVDMALNVASAGDWKKGKKSMGYDNFFHLYMTAEIESTVGSYPPKLKIVIEKNEAVNVEELHPGKRESGDHECRPVNMGHENLSLGLLLANTRESLGRNYHTYDSFQNNCQVFVKNVLQSNFSKEQLDNNEGLMDFVDQHVEDMLEKSPSYLQRLARGVTDLRGRVETGLHGRTRDKKDKIDERLKRERGLESSDLESIVPTYKRPDETHVVY
tara:strand:+ start:276 stop:1280 length:1005 start_codon:yes stop_codon:yes gene_type:complete